jgi:PKD repeat protein
VYPALGTNTVSLTVTGPLGTNTLTRPAYIVVTNVAPVTLTILATNNQVQLLWREGILQSAGAASDSYTNVPGASSPYTVGPDKSTLFFQVKVR